MRRFYRNILLFILPFAAAVSLLFLFPVPRKRQYDYLSNDCSTQAPWIWDRISRNPLPADIVFLGTSRTINAVSDAGLTQALGNSLTVLNLGYCRPGRNLQYILLHDLLKFKHPRQLIIEVQEGENGASHPVFPHLADARQLEELLPLWKKNALSAWHTAIMTQLELRKKEIYGDTVKHTAVFQKWGHSVSEDTIRLAEQQRLASLKPRTPQTSMEAIPLLSLTRMVSEANVAKCEVKFLYLPGYHAKPTRPDFLEWYAQNGEVLLPPDSLLNNPANWHDPDHMNRSGTDRLTAWLADQLR